MQQEGTLADIYQRSAGLLMALIDGFIPPTIRRQDSEHLPHARTVAALTLSLVLIATAYIPLYVWLGTVRCAIVLGSGTLGGAALLLMIRTTGRIRLAGNLTIAAYLATIAVQSCFQGGAIGPKFLWFMPIPFLAVFLSERRWAIAWIMATLTVMTLFITLYLNGHRFPNDVGRFRELIYSLHMLGLSIGMCLIAAFHESLRNGMLRRIRQAKEAAEVATKTKSQFLANMSHELRTPLAAILGFAEQLRATPLKPEIQEETLRRIEGNGRHLLQMLNDLLDLSRIESGDLAVHLERRRLPEILLEIDAILRSLAEAKNLESAVVLDTPIPEFLVTDAIRLKQILVGLISNAARFTQRGSIRLAARQAETSEPVMQFDVIDTGVGIRPEQLERLFDAFEQADMSNTRAVGGTGVGLAISRTLARCLGGDITCQSVFGQGSTFRVTIPLRGGDGCVTALSSRSPKGRAAAPTRPLAGARVLLAEDGPDNQRLLSTILRVAGADVAIVDNGRDAVLAVEDALGDNQQFDVVLMDMQMPVMDGYDATRRLRSLGIETPIVALTAHTASGDQEACRACGCTDLATKPIGRQALVELVRTHWSSEGACCESFPALE